MIFEYKYMLKKTAAAVIAVSLTLGAFGGAGVHKTANTINSFADEQDENAEYEKKLEELEQKISQLDEKIASAGSDINGQQEKLDAVNEKAEIICAKIDKVSKKAEEIETEMADIDSKMRDTQYELELSENAVEQGVSDLKKRLRVMYIAGHDTYSDVLLNADNFYDVLMRIELVKRISEHDNETIDGLIEEKNKTEQYSKELAEQSEELKEKSAEYSKKQQQLLEEKAQLEALQKEYGDSIESLNSELEGYLSQMGDLDTEYEKVSEQAATTTTTAQTTPPPETTAETTAKKPKKTKETKDSQQKPDEPEKTDENTEPAQTEPPKTEPSETQPPQTTQSPETTSKPEPEPEPDNTQTDQPSSSDIATVINYAKGMVGGRYVWAGNKYGATDCSGLVMLSYAQIGINLPHYAASQANYGTLVSRSSIQPGDLVFFGGSSYASIYHVAMYIGDGKVVHAESTATGIVISYLDSVAKYNNITCIKRLV